MISDIWKYLKKRSKPVNFITQSNLISCHLAVQSSMLTIIDGLLSSVHPPSVLATPSVVGLHMRINGSFQGNLERMTKKDKKGQVVEGQKHILGTETL